MNFRDQTLQLQRIMKFFEKLSFLFYWLKFFYPNAKGIPIIFQLYFFLPQKLFRINGRVPWPVHFTSRIFFYKNISIGNGTAPGMNSNCYIQGRNGIIIGHNVKIGPGVGLISANHHFDDYDQWPETLPITIGNNVWIGMNTVILPGIKIGDNVVIGASSLVNNDIPANSIAVGNPCKVIREKSSYKGKDYTQI
jgi:acetyltransferase-like isoleucine patch superfamily enzyme